MIYDHVVKVNGEYYPAGTDIPKQNEKKLDFTDMKKETEADTVKQSRRRKN